MRATKIKPNVIFDMDGTITKKDTYIPYLRSCLNTFGIRRWSLLLLPLYALLYKIRLITNNRLKEKFLGSVIGDIEAEKLVLLTKRFITQLFDTGLNLDVVQMAGEYQKKGHPIILASASFDIYTESIGRQLNFDYVVCTRAEVHNKRLTGRIDGANCYGNEKKRRIEKLIGTTAVREAIVYSDHYSDLPLLKAASVGYLVNPGRKTRIIAAREGYKMIPANEGRAIKILQLGTNLDINDETQSTDGNECKVGCK